MIGGTGQHLLDFHRDTVAVYHHNTAGDWKIVGQDFDLILFGGIQFDDGAAAEAHYLMHRH